MSKSCSQMASSSSRRGKKVHTLREEFIFQEWLVDVGLLKFIEMTGDCYPDLIPTNSVAVMSDHMIEIASSDGHILPYGVFISRVLKHRQVDLIGEKKIWCTESNEIGKATLRNNGLKKTKDGWVFKDVDETPSTFTLQTEFERFGVDQFRRLSTRISKVERSLIMIHKISDEDNALITPSISDSDDEDDTTKDESMETSNSD
ncbi:uncharacterized protein HKW66_Vig0153320 [Vigna angularis]|uniref:Uncharacterized protein n=1 Tax=Phaseolus angularis TaxID=3914 RepID=A0A8T0JKQ7_PHAAN|nr:uncharacterized protein HKW66_Vig0153320 [Vigna angularis]